MQKPEYECKCAQKWYLNQVSTSIIIILSLQIAILLSELFKRVFVNSNVINGIVSIIMITLSIVQLYYVSVTIGLIHQLDKDKCFCVDPYFKTFLTYYSGFRALFAIIVIILFIMLVGSVIKKKM